jgi:hypothetical protein
LANQDLLDDKVDLEKMDILEHVVNLVDPVTMLNIALVLHEVVAPMLLIPQSVKRHQRKALHQLANHHLLLKLPLQVNQTQQNLLLQETLHKPEKPPSFLLPLNLLQLNPHLQMLPHQLYQHQLILLSPLRKFLLLGRPNNHILNQVTQDLHQMVALHHRLLLRSLPNLLLLHHLHLLLLLLQLPQLAKLLLKDLTTNIVMQQHYVVVTSKLLISYKLC